MIEIEKPKVDIIELSEDYRYGKFVIEPLERGYGITIGNALRRVLLSSLPGVAVNSIKIDGVLHEFSTVPGVKEDVTEIILALKELSATIDGEGSRTLKIEAQGPCTIKGSDIICVRPHRGKSFSRDFARGIACGSARGNAPTPRGACVTL